MLVETVLIKASSSVGAAPHVAPTELRSFCEPGATNNAAPDGARNLIVTFLLVHPVGTTECTEYARMPFSPKLLYISAEVML